MRHKGKSWWIAGDFNCIISPLDVENGHGFNQKKCTQLSDLVKIRNLSDLFRFMHPNTQEFTFYRANVAASRLDRVYVSENLLVNVSPICHVGTLSDHMGVLVKFFLDESAYISTVPDVRPEYSFWKLNTSILSDENFLPYFSELWSILLENKNNFDEVDIWWEQEVKPSAKAFCMDFSRERAKRGLIQKKFWFAYLKVAIQSKNWQEIAKVKGILNDMLQEDLYGYVIRSRFQNNAAEESASLFHANRENNNGGRNNLQTLKINGNVCKDSEAIEEEALSYFTALFNGFHDNQMQNTGSSFKPDNSHLSFFFNRLSALSNEERNGLTEPMTLEELEFVVKDCKKNRSPGLDGLSYEFYQATFQLIKDELLQVLQSQLIKKEIIQSNRKGVTRLCPKVKGIPSVEELRPITLLNSDYKILSKWLVMRMRPVLSIVIKSGQLCTVEKRNIMFFQH